jgi:Helix-turn-helix domain
MITPLSHLLPPLPGFTALGSTYAPWPVWSGSVAKPVRFAPMAKKAAVRLWHRARDLDRGTHEPGRHGGSIGPTGLAVLHALIFDFLNHRTGRLDPSYAALAAKAGVCVRTVATALKRLRELGILNWVRRCAESWRDGRFVLEQETNAYAVLPESQWQGYRAPPEAPEPEWGRAPIMPSALVQAAMEGDLAGKVHALASDPKDGLAAALARLGQAFLARNA